MKIRTRRWELIRLGKKMWKMQPLFRTTVIENGQIIRVSKKRWDALTPTHKKNKQNPREIKNNQQMFRLFKRQLTAK